MLSAYNAGNIEHLFIYNSSSGPVEIAVMTQLLLGPLQSLVAVTVVVQQQMVHLWPASMHHQ